MGRQRKQYVAWFRTIFMWIQVTAVSATVSGKGQLDSNDDLILLGISHEFIQKPTEWALLVQYPRAQFTAIITHNVSSLMIEHRLYEYWMIMRGKYEKAIILRHSKIRLSSTLELTRKQSLSVNLRCESVICRPVGLVRLAKV